MRVLLAHDWLTGMRGGEKVLSLLCELFPFADIATLVHVPGSVEPRIERMRVRTSWLSDLPRIGHYYRYLLPIMPLVVERMDLQEYDLIVSSSHCVIKGLVAHPQALHVCYCHTPMRYAWAQGTVYQQSMGLTGLALRAFRGYLRAWDRRSAEHVDAFIANSRNVAGRIGTTYDRSAEVVYPPIDTNWLTPGEAEREDFYLIVSALAPYKKVDQAVEAFANLPHRLVVIGSGQQLRQLRQVATPNVELLGWQDDQAVREHYRRCRALIFPGEEDFGMVPLEAMACGAPVIAYNAGGARETVRDVQSLPPGEATGLLYAPQTPEGIAQAVEQFEAVQDHFDARQMRRWACTFGPQAFCRGIRQCLEPLLQQRGWDQPW
ncbi:MAG: glycosyltransferase [Planctomycetota bacterium]